MASEENSVCDRTCERNADELHRLREQNAVLRNVIDSIGENGTSTWESSLRCIACGEFVGTGGYSHDADCQWVRWKEMKEGNSGGRL